MAIDKTARTKKKALKSVAKKAAKTSSSKTRSRSKSLYSNLAYKRRVKADQQARREAEELAKLPKNPILRFFAMLRPDRFFKWWFSKKNQLRLLKIFAALVLLAIIGIGGLFLYFKKDLDQISLEELSNRVQNTVNTYLDRNGELLWEDKGSGDYRLVVDGNDISTYMRQATVAIEDKNFYNHTGVDFTALARAFYVTVLKKGAVQGGSTLTQQLIKQVYFSDEANIRDASGLPRKIKEMILAIEVEKMYDKEQIITLYLNQSPYGGRRNGVESAARTYFDKSAKDLDLAESALLAAIPNNPGVLNPYNTAGNEALIARQHKVLRSMVEMGYITQEECDEAIAVDIMDKIQPETNQYADMKAPWFVLEVKKQLEEKYGIKTMREGGFTIKTTIDLRAQKLAEKAVKSGKQYFYSNNSDNAALVSVDVDTAQVIAMVGSVDWNKKGYGQVNTTTSLLEPASSIKPILDYTPLFIQRSGVNYAPGTRILDNNIDSIYCAGNQGSCRLRNASGRFYGTLTMRQALAGSLNIPAVKVLYANGIQNGLDIAHKLGDVSYCAYGEQAGLSMAIGGGCRVKPIEHANAYASLARGGVYKDLVYWLEIKNSSGDVIDQWEDNEGTRVIDEQVAYLTISILTDAQARVFTFGNSAYAKGFYSNKVIFGAKTGTTDDGRGWAKDSWLLTVSPVLATAIWNGNHDGSYLTSGNHNTTFTISSNYIEQVHELIYKDNNSWKPGNGFKVPKGIKKATINGVTDVWPSWYTQKSSGVSKDKKVFDKISKKLATDCTPAETQVSVEITKSVDMMTKKEIVSASGYDPESEDDVHSCSDVRPSISIVSVGGSYTDPENPDAGGSWTVKISTAAGTYKLKSASLVVDGAAYTCSSLDTCSVSVNPSGGTAKIVDVAGYTSTVAIP